MSSLRQAIVDLDEMIGSDANPDSRRGRAARTGRELEDQCDLVEGRFFVLLVSRKMNVTKARELARLLTQELLDG